MELPSNTLGPTWYLIAIIVIASGGTIGTLYGNIHQYFIQPPQPKISLEILFDNISNSSIFLLTNNGFAPAKNLLFTIMLENISKKNIFSSENYTLIQDDPTMLKLYFPRFSFGYGSIAEVKTFHNTRLNLLKENYSSYVTYEQGSLKINTSIQTPKKVTSVTNPILNIILLIILTFYFANTCIYFN